MQLIRPVMAGVLNDESAVRRYRPPREEQQDPLAVALVHPRERIRIVHHL